MKISKETFFSIASDLKFSTEEVQAFWTALEQQEQFEISPFAKYLFYFGAMIVISAMTWFMNLSWDVLGGLGLFSIAIVYAITFFIIGAILWNKKGLKIPSGLFLTIAVCMVPLAIYGLETYFNVWPTKYPGIYSDFYSWINGSWIWMEIGTILAGVITLYYFPFPFLTAPIFLAAWFLTMDIVPFFFGDDLAWQKKCWMSLGFGLALIMIGFLIDRKRKEDFGFWSYFFGTLTFWCSLGCLVWDKNELILFIYLLINILMMCLAVLLRRNVLMVFGALGAFSYLGHLAYTIFEDSVFFPFILSFVGLAAIYLGVLYQRNMEWFEKNMLEKLPVKFRKLFDDRNDR